MRLLAQIAGIFLIYVAALYGVGGTFIETCTQGAADSLLGAFFCIPLYALGFLAIIRYPLPKLVWIGMLPAIAAIAYQTYWTLLFAYTYLIPHKAVCDLITGYGPFDFDGREPIFLIAWIFMCAMCLACLHWALLRSFSRALIRI